MSNLHLSGEIEKRNMFATVDDYKHGAVDSM
jgi:hypothetical protein